MKEYIKRIQDLNLELGSLTSRVKLFEELDIDIDNNDLLKDLLHTSIKILSHAESEIEDIYLMLYRVARDQKEQ